MAVPKKACEMGRPKVEDEDLKDKLAVKYFFKRSRKMFQSRLSNRENLETIESSPKKRRKLNDDTDSFALERTTCFAFFGLMPIPSSNAQSAQKTYLSVATQSEVVKDKLEDEDKFVEPKIFKCNYCTKIFFNRTVYRKHALKHVKIIRCGRCNKSYNNIVCHRRHKMSCGKRYRL